MLNLVLTLNIYPNSCYIHNTVIEEVPTVPAEQMQTQAQSQILIKDEG